MKLAASNIAWAPSERDEAYALLVANDIRGLEVAPGLFFSDCEDPFAPSSSHVERELDAVREAGLELVSMQSLLFGVEGAALFESGESRARFKSAMERAIQLAGRLSISNLVFGSPKQRIIPPTMEYELAEKIAVTMFRELGDAAKRAGTKLGIEFNPAAYGTNFLNDVKAAMNFVALVDHEAVTLNLDLGAMHMNLEFDTIEDVALQFAKRISHVHISEPNLAPAPVSVLQAERALLAMTDAGYARWYSIEMKQQPETGLVSLEQAIKRLVEASYLARKRSQRNAP